MNRIILDKIEKKAFNKNKFLYIPPDGSLKADSEITFDLLTHVIDEFINNKEKKVLLLQGSSGSGKSLFSKYLQNYYLREDKEKFVFRSDLNSFKNPYENLVEELMQQYEIDKKTYEIEIKDKDIIFIFDGFDEILGDKNLYKTNKIRDKFPNSKVIITCRDEYLSNKEISQNINKIFSPDDEINGFSNVFLRNFSDKQIILFLKEYIIQNKENEIMKEFLIELNNNSAYDKETDKIEKCYIDIVLSLRKYLPIINSPFLLQIICSIIPQNEAFQDKEKFKEMKRATIYDMFVYTLYEKEYFRRKMLKNKEKIKYNSVLEKNKVKEMIYFAQDIALDLLRISTENNELQNYIYYDPENKDHIFNKYYNDDIKTEFFRKTAEQTILKEVESGNWAFIHKSIMEFLVFKRLIKEIK